LPDGSFYYPKSQIGLVLEGLGMGNIGIYYDNLEYLRLFGIVYVWLMGNFVVIWYIFPVLVNCARKNLATLVSLRVVRIADRFKIALRVFTYS
jgi:hypothetical protein